VFGPLIISYFIILLKWYFIAYIKPEGIAEPIAAKEKKLLRGMLDQISFFKLKKKKL
jgi:hypothetical protein